MPKSVQKKKKKSPAVVRRSKVGGEHPSSAAVQDSLPVFEQAALPKKSGGFGLRLRLGLAAVAIIFVVVMTRHASQSTAASSAAAPAAVNVPQPIPVAWGNAVKLEKVSSFDAPAGVMDFYVGPTGDAVVLTGDALNLYVAGKLSRTAEIGMAPNRSLACNGQSIFVTDSDIASVAKFKMDLSSDGSFSIEGGSRLLGMAWTQYGLILSEVGGQLLYIVSSEGHLKGKVHLKNPSGFVYDVAPLGDRVAVTDLYNGITTLVNPGDKSTKVLRDLCPLASFNHRLAAIHGDLYVPCSEGAVLIVDQAGRYKGYLKDDDIPPLARTGHDGFLYIYGGGEIQKYKAL